MRRAVADDPDFRFSVRIYFRAWHERSCSLEFTIEAFHVAFEVVSAFAVLRFLVMSAAAGEVGGGVMVGAGQSAVADAVAVDVFVAGETSQPVQILFAEDFAAINRLFWI